MERVAITGATGMIGAALADWFAIKDVAVLAITNPNTERMENLSAEDCLITPLPCALSEYADFAEGPIVRKLPSCDVLYHFAWDGTTGPARNDQVRQLRNIEAACDAVRLAKALGCKRFVFAGSQAECGLLPEGVKFAPDTPGNPVNAYGAAKLEAAQQTRELAHELGLEHIHVRIGSVYGPCDADTSVLTQALFHAWHDEPFACTPCEQQWDHLYVGDAVDALWRLADRGTDGAVYCLGSGQTVPLREHVKMACEVANPDFAPDFGALEYPENQPMYLCADITTLTEDTGFEPLMDFADGITKTAEWYREQIMMKPTYPWEKYEQLGLDK